ncbi:MAG: hypothetical protein M5R36_27260 [Deltaproteobacteria bacterium]|nr:hypothetical protein [Deltaproteobacteria bacterium]
MSTLEGGKELPEVGDLPVFVTVFYKASPMIWGVGTEGTTRDRILTACGMILRNPVFEKSYIVDKEKLVLKIDVMTRRQLVKMKSKGGGAHVEPGVHGMMLQRGDRLFYQLPTDFIALGWEQPGDRARSRKLRMLSVLAEQAGLGSKGWRNGNVYRFRTVSFLQEAPDYVPLPLYRGFPSQKKYSVQDIQDAALQAGRHLLQNVQPSGRFRYEYDPFTDDASGFLEYNPTYHATGLYALSVLFQYSKRLEIIEQTKPPLLWMLRRLEAPLMEPEAAHVAFFGNARTDASAMTLLALTAMPSKVIEELGVARVNRLAYYLTLTARDDGRVYPTYFHKLLGFVPERPPFYLEGLTLLALTRYYQTNKNVEWLLAARKLAAKQIADFDAGGRADTWTVQALADMWRIEKDGRYAEACFRIADAILKAQFTNDRRPYADYVGGYDVAVPPRVFSAAIRAEALIAAYRLARTWAERPTVTGTPSCAPPDFF